MNQSEWTYTDFTYESVYNDFHLQVISNDTTNVTVLQLNKFISLYKWNNSFIIDSSNFF